MRCLWCFWFRYSRHKHHKRPRCPVETNPNPSLESTSLQCVESPQPQPRFQSRSQLSPRPPPPWPLPGASSSSLSSRSSGSIVRAVPLKDSFVTGPTSIAPTQQSSHTTGLQYPLITSARLTATQLSLINTNTLHSHDNRTVRSQPQRAELPVHDVSPAFSAARMPKYSFSARVARNLTRGSSEAHTVLFHPTFLDDASSNFSGDDTYNLDDSGYVSIMTTPVKPNDSRIGSTVAHSTQSANTSAPTVFERPRVVLPAQPNALQPQISRTTQPLCDQRHCLRHKQTCLEHAPTPPPPTSSSWKSQPIVQDRRMRRRPRMRRFHSSKEDVWMQVATEYPPGA